MGGEKLTGLFSLAYPGVLFLISADETFGI
jgi:hypothetical protein